MWTRPQSLISFFIFIELVKKYRMTGNGGILLLLGPFNEIISRATMSPSYRLFILRSFMFIITTYNEKYQTPFNIQHFFG